MTQPSDIEVRHKAADVSRSVILTAPAGSGKTSVLELRFLRALANSDTPEQVIAITFTVAAAGEIRERALASLEQAASGVSPSNDHELLVHEAACDVLELDRRKGWGLLRDPSRLRIMTIDALNSLIASSLPLVSRSGGTPTVDTQPHLLYREAIVNLFAGLEDPDAPAHLKEALGLMLTFGRHQVDRLIPLFESLLAARDQWLHPLLTSDVSHFEETLRSVVDATVNESRRALTDEEWAELVSILVEGSAYSEQLAWAAELDSTVPFHELPAPHIREVARTLLTGTGDIRKRVNKTNGFLKDRGYTKRMGALLKDLHDRISENQAAAVSMLGSLPDSTFGEEGVRMLNALGTVLIQLSAHLQVVFQNNGAVDFVEVHGRAMEALNTDNSTHGEFLIREERIRHILVDEVQDTSGAQIQLLKRMTGDWTDSDDRSLFLCGDPQQSIYGFRGADVGQFLALWEAGCLGEKSLECLALTNNFRSSPKLVNFFNKVFTHLFGDTTNRWTGQVPFSQATAFRTDLPGKVAAVPFAHSDGDEEEAELVCDQLEKELKEDPEAEIAILVRARSHLKSLLPMMRSRGIPAAGEEIDHLTEKTAVSDCVSLIKALAHVGDRQSWVAVLRSPMVGLKWDDCLTLIGGDKSSPVRQLLDDHNRVMSLSPDGKKRAFRLLSVLRRIEASERWRDIVWRCRCLWHSLGGRDVVDNHTYAEIKTVFKVLDECCEGGQLLSITRFEHRLSRLFAASAKGNIKLMTIHNAKGLQFDKVFLVGLNKNTIQDTPPLLHWKCVGDDFLLVPAPKAQGTELSRQYEYLGKQAQRAGLNEQKRLLYVAATRAKTELRLFCGLKRCPEEGVKASRNTFMAMLLPFLEVDDGQVVPAAPSQGTGRIGREVSVPKLPAGYRAPALHAESQNSNRLSGLPLEGAGGVTRVHDRESAAERSAGIVYHFMMERIATEGIGAWPASRIEGCKRSIIALLRRAGCPDKELAGVVPVLVEWVTSTVRSSVGQWLLRPRDQRWVEFKVRGKRDGKWFTDIMDLVFVEGETVWLIDYKSTFRKDLDLQKLLNQYLDQLNRYKGTLERLFPGKRIRPGIFEPSTQCFIEEGGKVPKAA